MDTIFSKSLLKGFLCKKEKPSRHLTSFQHRYDVVRHRTTSYRRWNDVVCLLGGAIFRTLKHLIWNILQKKIFWQETLFSMFDRVLDTPLKNLVNNYLSASSDPFRYQQWRFFFDRWFGFEFVAGGCRKCSSNSDVNHLLLRYFHRSACWCQYFLISKIKYKQYEGEENNAAHDNGRNDVSNKRDFSLCHFF